MAVKVPCMQFSSESVKQKLGPKPAYFQFPPHQVPVFLPSAYAELRTRLLEALGPWESQRAFDLLVLSSSVFLPQTVSMSTFRPGRGIFLSYSIHF